MGAWGIKALESDEGLDLVGFITDEYLSDHLEMKLSEIIAVLKGEFLGETFEEIDFLFDNSAMALTELLLEWQDQGKLDYSSDENLWAKVRSFTYDRESLDFLLRYLRDIRNEVPDSDGSREIVELWREEGDNPDWPEWSAHLDNLIARLDGLRETL